MSTWVMCGSTESALAPMRWSSVGTSRQPRRRWPSSSTIECRSARTRSRCSGSRGKNTSPQPYSLGGGRGIPRRSHSRRRNLSGTWSKTPAPSPVFASQPHALRVLINLLHRGACGCEANTGDGAGVLLQVPDKFLRRECDRLGIPLPPPKEYGCGLVFLPRDPEQRDRVRALLHSIVDEEGQRLLGWRDVPTDDHLIGASALSVEPHITQVLIGRGPAVRDHAHFERKLYVIRKLFEKAVVALDIPENTFAYMPSLSSNTLIYKGMLSADQIETMYPDLADPDVESALALVHQRFSTNTFPSWPLAHPYRNVAHNGENNTLRGNSNWMRAREALCRSEVLGDDLKKVLPVTRDGLSDSATFDNVLEFLVMNGRSLPHAILMMIPEPWQNHESMSPERRGLYPDHAPPMEPRDAPAPPALTPGTVIGAVLDRN